MTSSGTSRIGFYTQATKRHITPFSCNCWIWNFHAHIALNCLNIMASFVGRISICYNVPWDRVEAWIKCSSFSPDAVLPQSGFIAGFFWSTLIYSVHADYTQIMHNNQPLHPTSIDHTRHDLHNTIPVELHEDWIGNWTNLSIDPSHYEWNWNVKFVICYSRFQTRH